MFGSEDRPPGLRSGSLLTPLTEIDRGQNALEGCPEASAQPPRQERMDVIVQRLSP
jgi:hypothetical protein